MLCILVPVTRMRLVPQKTWANTADNPLGLPRKRNVEESDDDNIGHRKQRTAAGVRDVPKPHVRSMILLVLLHAFTTTMILTVGKTAPDMILVHIPRSHAYSAFSLCHLAPDTGIPVRTYQVQSTHHPNEAGNSQNSVRTATVRLYYATHTPHTFYINAHFFALPEPGSGPLKILAMFA